MSDKKFRPKKSHDGYRCGATGKIIFKSHESGVERGTAIMPEGFRCYKCNYCGLWHLTTKV